MGSNIDVAVYAVSSVGSFAIHTVVCSVSAESSLYRASRAGVLSSGVMFSTQGTGRRVPASCFNIAKFVAFPALPR